MLTVYNFDRSNIGNWQSSYLVEMGTIVWNHPDLEGIHVYATPSFRHNDQTPVEIYDEETSIYNPIITYNHVHGTIEEKTEFVRESLKKLFNKIENEELI